MRWIFWQYLGNIDQNLSDHFLEILRLSPLGGPLAGHKKLNICASKIYFWGPVAMLDTSVAPPKGLDS